MRLNRKQNLIFSGEYSRTAMPGERGKKTPSVPKTWFFEAKGAKVMKQEAGYL